MAEFFLTPMGSKFYQRDVPNIAKSLAEIASKMEDNSKVAKRLKIGDSTIIIEEAPDKTYPGVNVDIIKEGNIEQLLQIEQSLENKDELNIYIWNGQEDYAVKYTVRK